MKTKLIKLSLILCVLIALFIIPQSVNAATEGDFTYSVSNGEAIITKCSSSVTGTVVIPDTLGGYPVTRIGGGAFENCTSFTELTIPDGVTSIGEYAFSGCTGLTEITIPDSVTSIESDAFGGCDSLDSINVDKGNDYYSSQNGVLFNKDKTFLIRYPEGRKCSYEIPRYVTSIGESAFSGCTGLTEITIPKSVTRIENGAFYGCTGLTRTNIKNLEAWCKITFDSYYANPTYYSKNLYLNDELITELVFPDTITKLNNYAFCNCEDIKKITVPDSVTAMGEGVFRGCNSLEEITLPFVGSFAGCYDSMTYGEAVFGYIFGYGQFPQATNCVQHSLYEIYYYIPDSLRKVTVTKDTSFFEGAFANCSKLTEINIPNSVTSIGEYAFSGCTGLTEITIPESVTWIEYAFGGCTGLRKIKWQAINIVDDYYKVEFGINKLLSVIPLFDDTTESVELIFDEGTSTIVAVFGGSSVKTVSIPKSVTRVKNNAFERCYELSDVYYEGTEEEWNSIVIEEGNEDLINSVIHFCSDLEEYEITAVANVSLDKTSMTLNVGENGILIDEVLPSNATNKNVCWESSDTSVAIVSNGVVSAVGEGTATITVTTIDGDKIANCIVNVIAIYDFVGITMDDVCYIYDGTEKSVAISGILPAGASVVYEDEKATNVGIYNVKATVTAPGYNDLELNATMTIKPKTLTVTGLSAQAKTYDGTTDASLTGGTLNGVVSGDDVTATIPVSGTFAKKDAGTGIAVSIDEIVLEGADKGNYTLTQPTGLKANITKAALKVKADDLSMTKGGIVPELTYKVTEGQLFGDDTLTGALTTSANGTKVGTFDITQGTLKATSNYTLTFTKGKLTVEDKTAQNISVSAITSATYGDAPITLTVTPDSTSNLTAFTFESSNTDVAEISSEGVITIKAVGEADITVKQAGNDEYAAFENTQKLVVAKKNITVTSVNLTEKTAVLEGVLEVDTAVALDFDKLSIEVIEAIDETTSKVNVKNFALKGEKAENYTVTTENVEGTIATDNVVTLTITATNGTVAGAGSYVKGRNVTVVATPNNNYKFSGWYIADESVSTDATYTFVLDADTELVAKFSEKSSGGGGGGGGAAVKPPVEPEEEPKEEPTEPVVTVQPEKPSTSNKFNDVAENDWYFEYVNELAEKGIISGIGNGKFAPNDNVTREQFLKMIIEATNIEGEEAENTFEDVADDWYKEYVLKAKNLGIVNGVTDTKFGIGENITRQDMAVMITRTIEKTGITIESTEVDAFADGHSVSDYATEAVEYMKSIGLIEGYNNEYRPHDNLTRAEAAKVISELMKLL